MPSAAPDAALVARFRDGLERLLNPPPRGEGDGLGIALSGGPDSVALLLLAHAAYPGQVRAATVDHGLRAEAATEAEAAAALCATLGVPHETLRVSVASQASVQAAAREARYEALSHWAGREHLALLTAHHADDQAETLLMRLARGSGLAGLSGIRAIRREGATTVLRPLLDWRKTELEAIVAAAGITPARDPSNHDTRYDRTLARTLLEEADWLDSRRVAASAAHLAEAEDALDTIAAERAADALAEEGDAIRFRRTGLAEIDRRILRRLFRERFARSPDGPALERMMAALIRGETVTLADILCAPKGDRWRFSPAPPRNPQDRSS
jgi:tRNA(Ile)-lysidine synthase